MKIRLFCVCTLASATTGCATTSFAPPSVNLANETTVVGSNYSFGQRCMPNQKLLGGKVVPIEHNAFGAQQLINNFIYMYRCRAHSAANGRQAFEVPAIITAIGTTAAAAFGAGTDVAIAGGTTTALLNGGKSYYAPQQKADIYDSSLDALLCIKARAAGADPITVQKIGKIEAKKGAIAGITGAGATLTTDEQYYEIVTTALLSVERVLAQRLSVVGTFDPAGVIAEIKALTKEVEEQANNAKADAPAQAQALTKDNAAQTLVAPIIPPAEVAAENQKIEKALVSMATLQANLQQCVVRAKI